MKEEKFTAEVKLDEHTGDYYIELTDEICNELGWKVDDEIEWVDNEDGSFILRKKDNA